MISITLFCDLDHTQFPDDREAGVTYGALQGSNGYVIGMWRVLGMTGRGVYERTAAWIGVFTSLAAVAGAFQGASPQPPPLQGSVADALVGIEVVNRSKDDAVRQIRRGNGVVLRPDGFVLAPAALFSTRMEVAGSREEAAAQSITVTAWPGTPRSVRLGAHAPRYLPKGIGYTVVKIDDAALTAVRTLLPSGLPAGGGPLTVWWSTWTDAGGFQLAQHRDVAALPAEHAADADRVGFDHPSDGVPLGAVVTGPEGLVAGMVDTLQNNQAVDFATMAALNRVTNCVSPLPLPDGPYQSLARRQAPPPPPMVEIPGGRFLVSPALSAQQPDLEGSATATVAPFKLDRYQVTNEEYYAYWRTLPQEKRRELGFRSNYYPRTWAPWPADPPFPAELARLPVLGVPLEGAQGYAAWRGKRLPTPYEWSFAALGPLGETGGPAWIRRYLADRDMAWRRICLLHGEYLQRHPELGQRGALLGGWNQLPWIAIPAFLRDASIWSKETIDTYLDPLWAMWKDPIYVLPVGSREYDVSEYGVADMVMNGMEQVVPYPGPPVRGQPRYMGVEWLPRVPTPADPWMPIHIEALTNGLPLQPLSRLYRRKILGPSTPDLLLWSNLDETAQMLQPLSGWRLFMTGASEVDAVLWPRGAKATTLLGPPAGLAVWQGTPRHFHREMGREIPLEAPEPHPSPGPQLFYYLPTGFRCAR
ncbi:MAG: SUMF1/EgtB/PvdO family nonheme iron enzyme [Chthonomonadales bacterium]